MRSGQILLGEGFDYWLVKFDGVKNNGDHGNLDVPQYTLIEYAYYKMAIKAGINMSECKLLTEGDNNHFLTKRFDRVDGKKVHMQSLGALLHIDYDVPGLCSYELAAATALKMGLYFSDIEQFYRRMVFNVLAVNQDDHVKNISFLMNRQGKWSLSPAYDVIFAYEPGHQWLDKHQMSINMKLTDITLLDLLESGVNMGLKRPKCQKIIEEIQTVVKTWPEIARTINIREPMIEMIHNVIESKSI